LFDSLTKQFSDYPRQIATSARFKMLEVRPGQPSFTWIEQAQWLGDFAKAKTIP
jgi:hypothetical protein